MSYIFHSVCGATFTLKTFHMDLVFRATGLMFVPRSDDGSSYRGVSTVTRGGDTQQQVLCINWQLLDSGLTFCTTAGNLEAWKRKSFKPN